MSTEPNTIEHNMQTMVINANIGMNNIIEQEEILTTMMSTFKELRDILIDHSGPYGNYVVINNLHNLLAEPVFTKDGINIIRNIQYASPLEEYCRKMIVYIGSRIESEAGDGTTSAMIMSISAMFHLLERVKNNKTLNYRTLLNEYNVFVNKVEGYIDNSKFTIEDLENILADQYYTRQDIISMIAYHQAYTSSHGDIELAKIIAQLFYYTPEEAMNYICFQRDTYETKERVKFEIDTNQFSIEVTPFDNKMLNKELGTKYIGICDLLVIGEDLLVNSITYNLLKGTIEHYIKIDEPIVIITSSNMCQHTIDSLQNILKEDKEHRVAIFTHRHYENILNDMLILNLVSGYTQAVQMAQDSLNFVVKHRVNCIYSSSTKLLSLNGLYENNDNSFIHPYIQNKVNEHIVYTADHIKTLISNISKDTPNRSNREAILKLQKLYNKLVLTKRPIIRIGGSAYENTALVDVISDVINAVRTSIRNGFVLGNGIGLLYALNNIDSFTKNIFKEAFIQACISLRKATYKNTEIEDYTDFKSIKNNISLDILTNKEFDIFNIKDWILPQYITHNSGFIIQPANIDIEILKRFGEVALKFICSSKIVIPGGIFKKE